MKLNTNVQNNNGGVVKINTRTTIQWTCGRGQRLYLQLGCLTLACAVVASCQIISIVISYLLKMTFKILTQMQLGHFALKFEKLFKFRELKYFLGEPALESEISQVEQSLGVSFPAQVALFYKNFNGLRVEKPQLEVLPIERINFAFPNRLHFATFDSNHHLYFDTSQTNTANQWNIIAEDGFRVTLTMASFWSNKVFAWVEWQRVIWEENLEWKLEWEKIAEKEKAEKKERAI